MKRRDVPGTVVDDDGRTRGGVHRREKIADYRGGDSGSATEIREKV